MVIQLRTSDFMDKWVLESDIKEYCLKVSSLDFLDEGASIRLLQNALPLSRCVSIEPPRPLTLEGFLSEPGTVRTQLEIYNKIGAHLNRRVIVPFETHYHPYNVNVMQRLSVEFGDELLRHPNIKAVLRNPISHINIERDFIEEVYRIPNIVKIFNSEAEVHMFCGLDIANAETTVRMMFLLLESGFGKTSKVISVIDFMHAVKGNCAAVWVSHRVGADLRRQGYSLPTSIGAFTSTFQNISRILGDHVKLILNVDEKAHEETIQTLKRLSDEQFT